MSLVELAEVRKQLDKYLCKDWARPRTSLYGVPILFNRKKDGTLKICIDYRALNQQTRLDKYPLPKIDDLLYQLVNSYCLCNIDLHTGYHQAAIHPGDDYKTDFLPNYGLFLFLVLPFVLSNTPLYFNN